MMPENSCSGYMQPPQRQQQRQLAEVTTGEADWPTDAEPGTANRALVIAAKALASRRQRSGVWRGGPRRVCDETSAPLGSVAVETADSGVHGTVMELKV